MRARVDALGRGGRHDPNWSACRWSALL